MGEVLVWQTCIKSYVEDSYSPVWSMMIHCRREQPLGPRLSIASSPGPSQLFSVHATLKSGDGPGDEARPTQ